MEERPYEKIIVDVTDGVATFTLNNPERRNAIGPRMINELLYAHEDAVADDSVQCVVLTGQGRAFCAGADFAAMTSGEGDDDLPPKGEFKDLLTALIRTVKPVVAKVNGHAMGGGLGLVAASTFAVAARGAKLGTPEINVGLFPFMIMAALERVMSRRALTKMMLFGERITADDAAAAGLVNEAVDAGELDAAIQRYTDAVRSKSPLTTRLGLEAMRDVEALTLDEKLPILSDRLAACIGTEDAREGLMAFLQKREPEWKGR